MDLIFLQSIWSHRKQSGVVEPRGSGGVQRVTGQ